MEVLKRLDHHYSEKIHKMNLGFFEPPILVFGFLFNDFFMWIPPFIFAFTVLLETYFINKELKVFKAVFWMFNYVAAVLVTLLFTCIFKHKFNRKRPD